MIKKLETLLDKFAFHALVISVYLMLLLTVLNIVLRWFNSNLLWIDPLVRHLVLMSAFLGGVIATGKDTHIRIDLTAKLLEKINRPSITSWAHRGIYIITMIATVALTYAGMTFTKMEMEYGKIAFLNLHSGFLTAIIPCGMALIFLRYLFKFLLSFQTRVKE